MASQKKPGKRRLPRQDEGLLRGSFVTDRLLDDLREQIRTGKLKPGDPVMPVRELCKSYGISYNSVRRALEQLQREGLLSLEQGRGTFVKSAVPSAPQTFAPAAPAAPRPAAPAPVVSAQGNGRLAERRSLALLFGRAPEALFDTPGCASLLQAVERQVLENGDALMLLSAHPRKALPAPLALRAAGVEGVLLLDVADAGILHAYAESGLPCVLLDRWPEDLAVSGVVFDNFSGAYLLAKELLNLGHRAFAYLRAGGPADTNAAERESAIRLALKEDGADLPGDRVFDATPDGIDALAPRLKDLAPRPTAALVDGDVAAERLVAACNALGLKVPETLSVACFGARCRGGTLSAVRGDYAKMGESAVGRLRQLIAGMPSSRLRINIPMELARGRTIAVPPA
ncbi:MAG: GntR family transcriptional regulator [Planctomycetes bacterium]|nr:GntR family transcriptional regulator [Planctomycetota bacterium]